MRTVTSAPWAAFQRSTASRMASDGGALSERRPEIIKGAKS